MKSFFFFSKNFVAKNLMLKSSLKCDPGLVVKNIIYSFSECMVHSCHVHVMLCSLSGGSLEPAVTSLETLQACCNFLWNNSGMSIICYFFFPFYWYCACICSQVTIGDKIVETLYSNGLTSENKTTRTPPLPPPFKVEVFVVFCR